MESFRQMRIDTPATVAVTVAIALVAAVVAWRVHRLPVRIVAGLLTVAALVGTGLAVVNVGSGRYPTVGALIGGPMPLQATTDVLHDKPGRGPLPAQGSLVEVRIPSSDGTFTPRSAWLYVPPAWFGTSRGSLPVIELLHGTPGWPSDWVRIAQAQITADRYAAEHGGMAPVLVIPDINGSAFADSGCVNGRLGNIDTYLSSDVPRWVERTLGVSGDRSKWAVGGLSEGGTCSINLALRHPDRFSIFLAFSAADHIADPGKLSDFFPGSPAEVAKAAKEYDPKRLLERAKPMPPIRAWFEVGGDDGSTTTETEAMARIATRTLAEVKLVVVPGLGHVWPLWTEAFAKSLPWAMSRM